MKVETRSHGHASGEEDKIMTRKQKAESKAHGAEHAPKKPKHEDDDKNGHANRKSRADTAAEFEEFCKATKENLSVDQMREVLEANNEDYSASEADVISRW